MLPLLFMILGYTESPYPTIADTWVIHEWVTPVNISFQELQFARGTNYNLSPTRSWLPYEILEGGRTHQFVYIQEDGFICRRVRYLKNGKSHYEYIYLGCFYQTGNPPPNVSPKPKEKKDTPTYTLPPKIDFREESTVKGVTAPSVATKEDISICNISILNSKVKDMICDLGITVKNISYTKSGSKYFLEVNGDYKDKVTAKVKMYECEDFNVLKPNTWFGCNPVLKDSFQKDIHFTYTVDIFPQEDLDPIFSFSKSSYSVTRSYLKDIYGKGAYVLVNIYSQFKDEEWIDIECYKKLDIQIPEVQIKDLSNKPFVFPLDRLIGVTQWHGCTQYQCPHKGIDFGARLNSVVAIGDGTVVDVGWDSYGGKCNQGGNYVMIKHSNGMHSTYFHLDHYLVKKGSGVKKGQTIGVSGNTGKWNCQSLGYHLHLGVYKGSSSSTHVDPVKYIAVDWNSIPTLGKDMYPKRLSGDNPHPKF